MKPLVLMRLDMSPMTGVLEWGASGFSEGIGRTAELEVYIVFKGEIRLYSPCH